MALAPMLNNSGRLIGDFTITKLGAETFRLNASYAAQSYHHRWFMEHLPEKGVTVRNISLDQIGFQIAGPKARDLLARTTRADVSNEGLPFLAASYDEAQASGTARDGRITRGDVFNMADDLQTALDPDQVLETIIRYNHEQGLTPEPVKLEDLFWKSTLEL